MFKLEGVTKAETKQGHFVNCSEDHYSSSSSEASASSMPKFFKYKLFSVIQGTTTLDFLLYLFYWGWGISGVWNKEKKVKSYEFWGLEWKRFT